MVRSVSIARLQQCTTLGGVAVALAWGAYFVFHGRPGWALAGALFILFGYALVLATELVLMRHASRDDPTPPATRFELLKAWLGEVITAPRVFCWRQPFFTNAEPDHLPADAGGRLGVVLVHGFVCNRAMWNPWMARLREAGVPFVAMTLEPAFGSIEDYALLIDASVRRMHAATGRPVLVVAHSMGGVAVRAWLDACDADDLVDSVITISTPHRGTWLARFAVTPNARQMRLDSPWITALGRREPEARRTRFTCFYTACDNVVFPPSAATLPGADNRLVRGGVAHVELAFQEEVFNEVCRRVSLPAASSVSASAPAR